MGIRKIIEEGFEVSRDSATTAAVAAAATVLPVGSAVSNFAASNRIRISLSTGATQDTTVQSVDTSGQTITIAAGGGLTADVNSGATIRVRLMDSLDDMETATSGVSISSTQPLVGEMLFMYTGTDSNAIIVPQISPDGGAHFFSILGTGVAMSSTAPIYQKYVAGTHLKLTVINQSSDDFDVLIGFA